MKNFRVDAELIKSTRGLAGMMYSARIPEADRSAFEAEGGVPNGTLVSVGALETGEREIRIAGKPNATVLPGIVIRGEVGYEEAVQTDKAWGNFRNSAKNPLPVAILSVGDFLNLSEDYFATGDVNAMAVGQKFTIDATKYVGQLKKGTPTAGQVYFEVVGVANNCIPAFILGDGKLTKPYKMTSVEVKIQA